ncbi:hypothetical protein [Bacillus sp. B1-b2]|uniref:hypothetical protein n=1 Tax=Bacillus sp. B1-b2 TaxID=2653201 RepID=UPI0012618EE8|nr:hypothetical protein [Bacillus sp. B1-b2]KAB7667598.1 hypothetical protein F9279_15180 [Bacillus sp. B1-b2]
MSKMDNVYDQIYQQILQQQKQIELFQQEASTYSEEDREKLDRIEMALQVSKDILENMLTPGKKLNFTYEKGMISLELF